MNSRHVVASIAVGAGLAAMALVAPALADDGDGEGDHPQRVTHDGEVVPEPTNDEGYHERYDDEGNIIPEEPHAQGDETVSDRAELRTVEEQVDPAGSPDVYVCADPGDTEVTVVFEYPSDPADLKPADEMGPIVPGADQCAGKSMVVGN